ncbi:MAG: carbohydrate ABC transporter permease [Vampirovibrionales bacterium]
MLNQFSPKKLNPRPLPIDRVGWWVLTLLLVVQALFPFVWLLSTALKGAEENLFASPPVWLPQAPTLQHLQKVLTQSNMPTYLMNSLLVATLTTVMNLMTSILIAFPLARWHFKGKYWIKLLVLLSMMVPFQVLMIPLYQLMLHLGLHESNGYLPLVLGLCLPLSISGFGVLLLTQAMEAFPTALEDAARLDGATLWQQLWCVILPYLRPTLVTLAMFSFLASWGEFLWPSILVSQPQYMTLPLGLLQLQGQFSADWRLIAASTVVSLLPSLVFFLLMQRQLTNPHSDSGIK